MSDLTVADVLDRAADLIEPEGCWTQGRFAADVDEHELDGYAKGAVCWCAIGAIEKITCIDFFLGVAKDATDILRKSLGDASISDWNDAPNRTQAEVVSKLRQAAALAREQAA